MVRRKRARYPLPCASESFPRILWRAVLWFFLGTSLLLHAQQADLTSPQTPAASPAPVISTLPANPSTSAKETEDEANPAATIEPAWVTSRDSEGNIRQRIKAQFDFAVSDSVRLGLLFGQGFIYDVQSNSTGRTEGIRDLGVTGQWHPNEAMKFEGMVGISQAGATVNASDQSVPQSDIPITNVHAHITPAGEIVKVDLGFERSIYDLSPKLVANRVIRNQFVVHPEIALPSGWRLRALAEMGPMTRARESNTRYNAEFTAGHKLGKKSELYSTYGTLHYAKATDAGYFSPDLVQTVEGGWTTDVDRKAFSLSLDFGSGASHARQHADTFGPWGLSLSAQSYLTWKVRPTHELRASYEFYYDKSNPGVESSSSAAWHMSVLTISFRWATQ